MRFAAEQRRDQALSEVAGLRRENSELKDQLEKQRDRIRNFWHS